MSPSLNRAAAQLQGSFCSGLAGPFIRCLLLTVRCPAPPPARLQDSSGVSRDEMATALMEVSEGKVPTDRIALRELARELTAWPALDEPASEPRHRGWGWEWVLGGRQLDAGQLTVHGPGPGRGTGN